MSRPQGSKYYCLPANYTHITVPFSTKHTAVDYGYIYGHENPPLVAISDAVVVNNSSNSETGNTIAIGWDKDDFTWYAEYMHNAKYAELPVGTQVKQGDKIGTMGNTGYSKGVHVHLILYKVPLGTPFRNSKQNRVNPNDYCFRFPNQTVNRDNKLIKDVPKEKKLTEVKGVLTVTTPKGLNERVEPTTKSAIRKTNAQGSKLNYVGWLENEGYYWYKLTNGNYTAYRAIGGEKFAEYKDDVAPQPKPPTPKDEYISVGGKQTLYRNSTGDAHYGARVQNLKTRSMKVLDKANGRTLVEAGSPFDVSSFWVQTSSAPQPKPKVKYAKVGGRQTLYRASSGNARYGSTNQNLSTRDMKVLAEANGRVQVDATQARSSKGGRAFDVNSFWVLRDRVSFVYKDK